jgi:predicted trehalose synthase
MQEACEARLQRLEDELAAAMKRRGPERLDRLEAHLDRLGELIDGVIDVLIVTHPDSHALYQTLQKDAKARLRLVRRESS